MLAEEVTEMEDYGYFIDIDKFTILSTSNTEKHNYEIDKLYLYEKDKSINNKGQLHNKHGSRSLFYVNTICFVSTSILFLKLWFFPSKN
jgi:hypothetical protein